MAPPYLLDTNAVSAAIADRPRVKARIASPPGRLVTRVIVRGEIYYGLERLPPGKRRNNLKAKADLVFAAPPNEPITEAGKRGRKRGTCQSCSARFMLSGVGRSFSRFFPHPVIFVH